MVTTTCNEQDYQDSTIGRRKDGHLTKGPSDLMTDDRKQDNAMLFEQILNFMEPRV